MPFINIRPVREVIAHDPARLKAEMAGNITRAVTEATGLSDGDILGCVRRSCRRGLVCRSV